MDVTGQALRKLHHLYSQLEELRQRLDRGPKQIKVRQASVTELESQLTDVREKTTAARMAADQKQLQLKTGEAKILDLRGKLNTCNTNREYQALLEQIAGDEMTNSVLEDEILEGLERIEQLQVKIGEAEKHVQQAKAELEKAKTEVSEKMAAIKADIDRYENELVTAQGELPPDFRREFERVVVKGADSMAPVDNDCCGGCYQQLTPNLLNKLYMSQVVCCTGCGRMLYLPEDVAPGK